MRSARATTAEWVERMLSTSPLEVASELGHDVREARGASGGAIYGCPACNGDKRHPKRGDKRGAVGLTPNGMGWWCFECNAGGNSISFVAYSLQGHKYAELGDAAKAEVRAWCMRFLGLDNARGAGVPRQRVPPRRAPAQPAPAPEPVYPPAEEVAALWNASTPVDKDPHVRAWLEQRGISPAAVAAADLARVAPVGAPPPTWAGFGGDNGKPWRSWPSVGLRLVVPLYDHKGRLRSVLFRRTFETDEHWPPKSAGAHGFSRKGLAMACPLARHLLEHGQWPGDWPTEAAGAGKGIIVAEGEMDFLTYATDARDASPATIGGFSGSWTLLEHVPRDSVLVVQTDNDAEGEKYANQILGAVMARWKRREVAVKLPSYFQFGDGKVTRK